MAELSRLELVKEADAGSLAMACEAFARRHQAKAERLAHGLLSDNSQGRVTAPWVGSRNGHHGTTARGPPSSACRRPRRVGSTSRTPAATRTTRSQACSPRGGPPGRRFRMTDSQAIRWVRGSIEGTVGPARVVVQHLQ